MPRHKSAKKEPKIEHQSLQPFLKLAHLDVYRAMLENTHNSHQFDAFIHVAYLVLSSIIKNVKIEENPNAAIPVSLAIFGILGTALLKCGGLDTMDISALSTRTHEYATDWRMQDSNKRNEIEFELNNNIASLMQQRKWIQPLDRHLFVVYPLYVLFNVALSDKNPDEAFNMVIKSGISIFLFALLTSFLFYMTKNITAVSESSLPNVLKTRQEKVHKHLEEIFFEDNIQNYFTITLTDSAVDVKTMAIFSPISLKLSNKGGINLSPRSISKIFCNILHFAGYDTDIQGKNTVSVIGEINNINLINTVELSKLLLQWLVHSNKIKASDNSSEQGIGHLMQRLHTETQVGWAWEKYVTQDKKLAIRLISMEPFDNIDLLQTLFSNVKTTAYQQISGGHCEIISIDINQLSQAVPRIVRQSIQRDIEPSKTQQKVPEETVPIVRESRYNDVTHQKQPPLSEHNISRVPVKQKNSAVLEENTIINKDGIERKFHNTNLWLFFPRAELDKMCKELPSKAQEEIADTIANKSWLSRTSTGRAGMKFTFTEKKNSNQLLVWVKGLSTNSKSFRPAFVSTTPLAENEPVTMQFNEHLTKKMRK